MADTPELNNKPSSNGSLEKQVFWLKIAVGVLAIALIILGIKIFWPVTSKNTAADGAEQTQAVSSQDAAGSSDSITSAAGESVGGSAADKKEVSANSGSTAENSSGNAADSADSTTDAPSSSAEAGESSGSDTAGSQNSGTGSSPSSSAESDAGTTESEKTDTQQAPSKVTKGCELVYSVGSSWEDSGVKMCTVEFSLTNHDSASVKDWTLVLTIEKLVSVTGWNGTYTVKEDKVTITGADHNKEIFADGTIYLGCNVGTNTAFNIKSAALDGVPCIITAGNVNQNAQNNGNGNQGNSSQNNQSSNDKTASSVDVEALLKRAENAMQGDDWLHTDGSKILDKDGKQVWLTGVNWFGYNTGTNTFDGLWNSKLEPTVKAIADHGFNLIRVPFSAQLINQWAAGEYPKANFNQAYNAAMTSMNSLEIFEYFLSLAEANGIKVMIDIHSAETDASGHNVNLWYTSKVSADQYYAALEWMADRYKNNDTIIAYDLKNEPHGKPNEGNAAAIWNDSKQPNNWKYVAETAASKVLAKNPNVLIMVEGTEIYPKNNKGDYSSTDSGDYYFNWWGGNLRAVKDFPIDLGKYQDKLVYSPHDYGPTVYKQPWFEGNYTYDSLMKDCWHDNWFYIYEDNTAPLLIGEWGGFMSEPNLTWMTHMRKLIQTYHLNHTFWCLNANSGDTGGLLLDDFTTWDSTKYDFVKQVLWQENGKFVGLDHAIPLGDNGITLKDAAGLK